MLFEIIFASCVINVAVGQVAVVNPVQVTTLNPAQVIPDIPATVPVVTPEQGTGDKPAQATTVNTCSNPELKIVTNLNVSQFINSWYGIKQSSNNTYECATVDFRNNGTMFTVHYQDNKMGNETFTFDVNTADTPDKFVAVLATNYTSYALLLKCEKPNNTTTHQPNLWILSRNKTISTDDAAKINETIRANKLENVTLTAVNQDDEHCKPVSASSVLVGSLTLVMLALTSIF